MRTFWLVVMLGAAPALAQTWNSNAGGWNTGYGTVYGGLGLAMATQNMYNTMQANIQRSMLKQAMERRYGKAAVEKAERDAANKGEPVRLGDGQALSPPPVVKNLGAFKPSKSNMARQLGDTLGSTPDEKRLITQLATATKTAFESQAETSRYRNNVAGALTFFLVSNVVVALDSTEPSPETANALFVAINQSLDTSPDFARASPKQKQELYDLLIGFAGLPLAVYTEAKERGDAQELEQARELARQLLLLVLKTDAKNIELP